ncbi:Phosphotransferase enzyme family protein [Actinacidiphila yanglinensis]|uniref:Phosphotransferase enzyme family protein n=2 Tax=Actinacidiphila yanglinensis TaxID=310779 RepID=A0A1H6DYV9_9ACTN|nr:Phosphotransferase enzyme family protein [Actinacidiphila yanglinensis]
MNHLSAHGYPVPRLRPPGPSPLPPTDLVMRRLSGPTLLAAVQDGNVGPAAGGALLASLLHRLHAVPARIAADPAHRVLHLDLHPDNVMLTSDGPVVIDWCNSREGPAAWDWAMSALILAQAAVLGGPVAAAARAALTALLGGGAPLAVLADPDGPALQEAVRMRTGNPTMSAAEVAAIRGAAALVRELSVPGRPPV